MIFFKLFVVNANNKFSFWIPIVRSSIFSYLLVYKYMYRVVNFIYLYIHLPFKILKWHNHDGSISYWRIHNSFYHFVIGFPNLQRITIIANTMKTVNHRLILHYSSTSTSLSCYSKIKTWNALSKYVNVHCSNVHLIIHTITCMLLFCHQYCNIHEKGSLSVTKISWSK